MKSGVFEAFRINANSLQKDEQAQIQADQAFANAQATELEKRKKQAKQKHGEQKHGGSSSKNSRSKRT